MVFGRVQVKAANQNVSFPGYGLTFCLHILPLWSLTNVNSEHHYLWSHGGHSVAEAELVRPIHVSSESVFPTGFSVAFVDPLVIGSCYLEER